VMRARFVRVALIVCITQTHTMWVGGCGKCERLIGVGVGSWVGGETVYNSASCSQNLLPPPHLNLCSSF